jgi:hypothetical protein
LYNKLCKHLLCARPGLVSEYPERKGESLNSRPPPSHRGDNGGMLHAQRGNHRFVGKQGDQSQSQHRVEWASGRLPTGEILVGVGKEVTCDRAVSHWRAGLETKSLAPRSANFSLCHSFFSWIQSRNTFIAGALQKRSLFYVETKLSNCSCHLMKAKGNRTGQSYL